MLKSPGKIAKFRIGERTLNSPITMLQKERVKRKEAMTRKKILK